jgi:phage shock protein C
MENKLKRNEDDKIIGGVASGLAEYFNTDPAWVRVGFVLAVFAGLSGILIYIILWIAIPARPSVDYRVRDDQALTERRQGAGRLLAGLLLIFMGVYFFLEEFDFLPYWVSFDRLWPLVLIIPGIMILAKAGKKDQIVYREEKPADKQEDITNDPKSPDQPV